MTSHPTWDNLVDFAEGRLNPEQALAIQAHLAACDDCAHDERWLRQTLALLGQERFKAPPASVRAAALARFDRSALRATIPPVARSTAPRPSRHWSPSLSILGPLAAVAALLILALALWRQQPVAFVAAVQSHEGSVTVESVGGSPRPVAGTAALSAGDEISTGAASEASLSFGDSNVTIELQPDSQVRVEQILLEQGGLQTLKVECERGAMRATVRNTTLEMNAFSNRLRSSGGTFTVSYLDDYSTAVTVSSGQLHIANEAGARTFQAGESVLLWYETIPGDPLSFPLEESEEPEPEPTPESIAPPPEDDFFGIVEALPDSERRWTIGGRIVVEGASIRLEGNDGPIKPGDCAEVRLDEEGMAERIRARDPEKCARDD